MKYLNYSTTIKKRYFFPLKITPTQIKFAIRAITKKLPFIKCYNKALTTRILLAKRGYPSTLFIGFKKNEKKELKGHAWLKCKELMITGGKGHQEYTIVGRFD